MTTTKLYWDDAFATSFETEGCALGRHGERASIVLDRTLFYPEAGGQLGDTGKLHAKGFGALAIVDTQIDEDGRIHHVLGGSAPEGFAEAAASLTITGQVEEKGRRDLTIPSVEALDSFIRSALEQGGSARMPVAA